MMQLSEALRLTALDGNGPAATPAEPIGGAPSFFNP